MTMNDIPAIREVLDGVESAILGRRQERRRVRNAKRNARRKARARQRLLDRLGPKIPGLLLWHFGASWESHAPGEIPTGKIVEFAAKYAA
jgi:hypothetical protein